LHETAREITCMQYALGKAESDPGVVAAGGKDGCIRLYGVEHLKPVGIVNIPSVLPDDEPPHAIRYLELFDFSVLKDLSWTMLTIDARSRMRIWGMRIHKHHGLLCDLKIIVDGDQPLPLRLDLMTGKALCVADPGEAEKEEARRKKEAEKEAAEKEARRAAALAEAAKKGKLELAELEFESKEDSKPSVNDLPPAHSKDSHVTALCVVKETMALPTFERFRWIEDTLKRRLEQLLKDRAASEEEENLFLTAAPQKGKAEAKKAEEESSDEDADSPEVVQPKLELRPRTPPVPLEDEPPAPFTYTQGDNFVFLADAGGWIRCVDLHASATAALELVTPLPVGIKDPVVYFAAEAEHKKRSGGEAETQEPTADGNNRKQGRTSCKPEGALPSAARRTSTKPPLLPSANGFISQLFPPKPECWKAVGAWRASEVPVLSLVSTTSPPGLVSADMSKTVKVWSTAGELWAHFSLLVQDGIPEPVTLWPPPHSLAAQLALMKIAQGLTERLGMVTSKKQRRAEEKALRKSQNKRCKTQSEVDEIVLSRSRFNTTTSSSQRGSSDDFGQVLDFELLPSPDEGGEPEATDEQGEEQAVRKGMTQNQIREMVRSGAFSSGFTSYKAFKVAATRTEQSTPKQTRTPISHHQPSDRSLNAKRADFHDRRASSFGLTLWTTSDEDHWQMSTRGLGSRSSSDGALVRFTKHAVTDMTRTVYSELGVDVRTTNRSTIRRPSFPQKLDISGVSRPDLLPDPKSATTATGQAVQRILNTTAPPDIFASVKSAEDDSGGGSKKRNRPGSSLKSAGKLASRK
jgi:hypothetical protein